MTPFDQSRRPTVAIQSKSLPGKLVDWRRVLATHYKHLGRTSRLHRFRTIMPNDALQSLVDDASPDIVLGIKAQGRIIGVLEIFKGTDGHAEIGISVEDAYQGEGFGTALFLDGLVAAEKIGVRTADLYFGSANQCIRSLVLTVGGRSCSTGQIAKPISTSPATNLMPLRLRLCRRQNWRRVRFMHRAWQRGQLAT
jgi:GNAT superfamily N-acetyltransferase